ncbi:hypothetical protein [Prochlorococcus marinus]|jgi:hypothetical protein|uniref:Uncharacterized protein n=1 Tax=Prochlorococcus marinus (strain MIT 9301) TaxID=167546 RepID=A3PC42_PROM0|nr:hypothetical protein [Prochlorococcus marinus]ABO17317.1 Conserved hypothetical protein [Prochlorococcus marinus str. MIT 9301]
MRIKYNFAFKNSKLSPWQRPAPPNLLVTDASIDKKLFFLYQEFNKNAEIFYPSSLILILSFVIYLINIFPTLTIKKFEADHNQYSLISSKLLDLNSSKQRYKKNLNNLEEYFSQSTTSYLFAFYLQNSVPKGVKINSYSFSDNGFDINLSSYSLDSINEFITLIIESPVINKKSVTINQINRLESNSNKGEKVSTIYDLEIYGQTAKIDIKKREDLYRESNANGLLRKLQRFNYLKSLLRG